MTELSLLPFDLTAVLPSNLIKGEERTLVKVSGKNNRMIAPLRGAYYKDTLEVRTSAGVALKPDVDYVTTYYYSDVWDLTAKSACAIIVVINPAVGNNIRLSYQAIGGHYSLDVSQIDEIFKEINSMPENIGWDDIIGKPLQFNPAAHTHEYWQLYGMDSTVENLELLGQAWKVGRKGILADNRYYYQNYLDLAGTAVDGYNAKVMAHINDKANPHATDKTKISLGNINNWGIATLSEAGGITVNNKYQSMGGIYQQLTVNVIPLLNSHIANTNNPHAVKLTDPLLNLYSTTEINNLFAQCLARTATAFNTAALSGVSAADIYNNIRTNLSTANVDPSTQFTANQLATVPANPEAYAYVGNQTYRTYDSLMSQSGLSSQNIIFIGNDPLSSYLSEPVGTCVITGTETSYWTDQRNAVDLKVYIRTSGGWQQTL